MRRNCSTGIIFAVILLIGLGTSCNNQDKPKERIPNKKITLDTIKLQKSEVRSQNYKPEAKQSIADKNIELQTKRKKEQLPKLVLISTSQACDCTLERCAKGEKTVNEFVQQFPKKLTFEKLNYAKEQGLVTQLAKEYQLHYLPALLFFDKKETFKGKLEGFLNKEELEKKLKETVEN